MCIRDRRTPREFSSWLGGTQIRDPATPADLAYVRRMMLNMDPPEHSRLRRLLGRAFTARAVARLDRRIGDIAAVLADRVFGGSVEGEFDFLSLIHISEPTRLGMISYAVFCLKKKKK